MECENRVFLLKRDETEKACHLFDNIKETMVYSCLQGAMGKVYADRGFKSAAAQLGDFVFFAGEPMAELVTFDYGREYLIAVPENGQWEKLIENTCGEGAVRWIRFATKKDPEVFDTDRLKGYAEGLAEPYCLSPIKGEIYDKCLAEAWSRDLVVNFNSKQDFEARGVGVAAICGGEVVAGASSHNVYDGGIEVEISTREDHRKRGLATACSAALILECLRRGLYPSWDAHTKESLRLANKLGYEFDREYPVYLINKR